MIYETVLDLLFYANSPLSIENHKDYLLNKYFPEQEFENFIQFFGEYSATKVAELKLTKSEHCLLEDMAVLVNSPYYAASEFDKEIIARLPEFAKKLSIDTMHYYFGKMGQFWNNHIHSNVAALVEEHRNFCVIENSCPIEPLFAGNSSNIGFDYCVEELLLA